VLSADARVLVDALRWWSPDASLGVLRGALRERGCLDLGAAFERRFNDAFVELVAAGFVTVGAGEGGEVPVELTDKAAT